MMVYVDDLLVLSRNASENRKTQQALERKYGKLTSQHGDSISFVGTTIKTTQDYITITCEGFITKLAADFEVSHPAITPTPSDYVAKSSKGGDKRADVSRYRSLVMSLMYVAKRCRPDILVNAVMYSTKIKEPSERDFKAALRTLRYLLGTRSLGISFSRHLSGGPALQLDADAAFNVHDDAKSHSGVAVFAQGGPVYYKSSKQKLISKSSTEAEMIACDMGVDMLMWVIELARDMGYMFDLPVPVGQDNQSAIFIFDHGKPTKKRAPINVRFEYVLALINEGTIKIMYVPTDLIKTDILTKFLHGEQFHTGAPRILGRPNGFN